MLKNIVKLEVKVSGRDYTFLCDNDAPLIDIKEVLFQYSKYVGSIEDAVKAQQEKAQAEADAAKSLEVKEEPKPE